MKPLKRFPRSYDAVNRFPRGMGMDDIQWRFLDTGKGNAFFNMAVDEAAVETISCGLVPPTIRLYEWEPSAVTIGFNQRAGDFLDSTLCRKRGVDVTRRLTGGYAVLHDKEVAYSVIGYCDGSCFGKGIRETYLSINTVIVNSLQSLGIAAKIRHESLQTGSNKMERRMMPCFLSGTKYEISLCGVKIVGSAQRRFGRVFLQQGSILLGSGQEKILDYFKDNCERESYKRRLTHNMTHVLPILSGINADDLKNSLYRSFARTVMFDETQKTLHNVEHTSVRQLIEQRYASKGWVFGDEQ